MKKENSILLAIRHQLSVLGYSEQEINDQDIAVVLMLHNVIDVEKIKKIKYVFDCTNKLNWAKNL